MIFRKKLVSIIDRKYNWVFTYNFLYFLIIFYVNIIICIKK